MPRRPPRQKKDASDDGNKLQKVWTLQDGKLSQILVGIGATDGRMTELKIGDIEPGTALVVDTVTAKQ
jgi:HlyD family secretion protein